MFMVHMCDLEFHDALLQACQQHRMKPDFSLENDVQNVASQILPMFVSRCPTSFSFLLASSL